MTDFLHDRKYLRERHRLSHQQIDRLLGENSGKKFLKEKLDCIKAVENFLSVTDLLRSYEIPFVCLKGATLSYRIYKELSVRVSHDIDILIELKMVEKVLEVFLNEGFSLTESFVWSQNKAQQKMITHSAHHLSLYNKEKCCCVEFHWTLMQGLPVSEKRLKTIIARNLTEENISGRKFTLLSKELELLFLLIHGSRHQWSRLKWLIDIKEYPINEIDEEKFCELAKLFKAGRIIGQANYLLKEFFYCQLPFKGDNHLPEFFICMPLRAIAGEIKKEQSIKEHINSLRYHLLMFRDLYFKCRVIGTLFFRPNDMTMIDSSYRIVYYLYRPYSLIKRRVFHA